MDSPPVMIILDNICLNYLNPGFLLIRYQVFLTLRFTIFVNLRESRAFQKLLYFAFAYS